MLIIGKKFFLLNNLDQVEEFRRYLDECPEVKKDLCALTFSIEVETKLSQYKIPYFSAREFKKISSNQLVDEDRLMENFFSNTSWANFEYKGIFLPTIFRFRFRSYLQEVLYYGNIFTNFLNASPDVKSIVVFSTLGSAQNEVNSFFDSIRSIAISRGLSFEVMSRKFSLPVSFLDLKRKYFFLIRRIVVQLFFTIYNWLVVNVGSSQSPRLIISDYWKNIGPSIELLEKGECIFLDRSEIFNIGWRKAIRYRMRFFHIEDFVTYEIRSTVSVEAEKLTKIWHDIRNNLQSSYSYSKSPLGQLLLSNLDTIIMELPKMLREIGGTYELYRKLKPDVVILRASVSKQIHFLVLPLVAKKIGIPSLEVQHGLEYLGAGSFSREHLAEYIALYGPLIKKEFISLGYSEEKLIEIGSPRFDKYWLGSKYKTRSRDFTILCIAPDIRPFEIYDSYCAEDYFNMVASSVRKLRAIKIIIKLRPTSEDESELRLIAERSFVGIPHTIVHYENLSNLFNQADVVISCYSTAILEALQFGLPVVIPALNMVDRSVTEFHFLKYLQSDVLQVVSSQDQLSFLLKDLEKRTKDYNENMKKVRLFLNKNFCFDGNSSGRLSKLINNLSRKK